MRRVALVAAACLWACPKAPEVAPKDKAEGHYLAFHTAFLAGDFAKAHTQLDAVKALVPGDPRLPAAEGELLFAEGKVDLALQAFERALALDAGRATTLSRVGALHLVKGHTEAATAALTRALALNPRDFNALEGLGELEQKAGRPEAAAARWLAAGLVAPKGSAGPLVLKAVGTWMSLDAGSRALEALEVATDAGVRDAAVAMEYVDRLLLAGRLDDALLAATRAAQVDGADPTLWEVVGELLARLGRPGEAREAFAKSLAVQNRALVHVALARLCEAEGDAGCVVTELDAALASASGVEPREAQELARLLGRVGRRADALTLLKALAAEPDSAADVALQLETARLARTLSDDAGVREACARVADAGVRCP